MEIIILKLIKYCRVLIWNNKKQIIVNTTDLKDYGQQLHTKKGVKLQLEVEKQNLKEIIVRWQVGSTIIAIISRYLRDYIVLSSK